jgi:hypothetical protein
MAALPPFLREDRTDPDRWSPARTLHFVLLASTCLWIVIGASVVALV